MEERKAPTQEKEAKKNENFYQKTKNKLYGRKEIEDGETKFLRNTGMIIGGIVVSIIFLGVAFLAL
ncbi:hypothetical protein QWY86_18475 [Pedobacter aquatilis]|uniref:hypothetical protein n=1 Tax=Pedobacter aquatilis TaxID=351343 RepID=UPI0025B2CB68|nr:hypothetical protein [Pedobacter aquatilis]MDN3588674.1 hypothetical protein [Pedobacter aquatilis]